MGLGNRLHPAGRATERRGDRLALLAYRRDYVRAHWPGGIPLICNLFRRRSRAGLGPLLSAMLLVLAALSGGCSGQGKQTVVVLGPWTGNEAAAFTKTLDLLDNGTPYTYTYQGTRSLRETLVAQLEADAPPDVAILNSQGELSEIRPPGRVDPADRELGSKAIRPGRPR